MGHLAKFVLESGDGGGGSVRCGGGGGGCGAAAAAKVRDKAAQTGASDGRPIPGTPLASPPSYL